MLAGEQAEFDALIGAYSCNLNDPVAVAVSGGSDSTALLYKTAAWAQTTGRQVLVLTVDHQLRPAAASEALEVKQAALELGLAHEILVWTRPKPGQAAARQARHRLLAQAACDAGAKVLLLGHTLDDVMETVLIRKRQHGSRVRLAGPTLTAPSPVWPEGRGLTLIRPLLMLRRGDLTAALKARGITWVDDPSNHDRAYERVRVRAFLERHPTLSDVLRTTTVRMLEQRQDQDCQLSDALLDRQVVQVDTAGLITCKLNGLEVDLQARLLAILLRVAGGHDQPPRAEAVARLLAGLNVAGERRTLSGAWVQQTKTGYLLGRDPSDAVAAQSEAIWDGRYIRDETAALPDEVSVLLRASRPPGAAWRSLASERIANEAKAYQTRRLSPVQR